MRTSSSSPACNTTLKIGGDNPDNIYWNATIAGDREYPLRHTRHGALSILRHQRRMPTPWDGTLASAGELDAPNITVDADGTSRYWWAATRQAGNWLPMSADSTMLLVVTRSWTASPKSRPS